MRQMVAYRAHLAARCKVCTPHVAMKHKPVLEIVSDMTRIRHKRPGWPRSKRQLAEDGCVIFDPSLRSSDGSAPA
jgi:hypothetical protein